MNFGAINPKLVFKLVVLYFKRIQYSTLETLYNLYQPENLLIYCSNILEGLIPRSAALLTYTLEDHPAGKHRKALANMVRYFQVIVLIVMKIEYFPAGNTVQVVMVRIILICQAKF